MYVEILLIGGAESEVDGNTVESRPDRDELIAACKGLENERSILSSLISNKTVTQVQDRLEDLEAEGTFKSVDHGEIASRE